MPGETGEAPVVPGPAEDKRRDRAVLDRVMVGAVVIGGLALRLWVINSNLGPIDSDEAAGGLIARHFAQGEGATFLWGNSYGGTLEAILAAPLMAVAGASAAAWKSVMIVLYGVTCLLTWRIGLRTVGPRAAVLAASVLWLAPAPLVLMSTKARLYYGASLVLTSACVLLCLRLVERRSRQDMAILGLVVGLGIWTSPFVLYVFVPVLAWMVFKSPRRLADAPVAVPGALIGAAPWLAYNLGHSWVSLDLEARGIAGPTYTDRLRGFFTGLLPRLIGLRTYGGDWQLNGIGKVLFLVCLAGVAVLVVAWLARRLPSLGPLVLILLAYPFLFAAPQASWYVKEPRYGLFLAPTIALLVAAGVTRLVRRPAGHVAFAAFAALVSVAGLAQLMEFGRKNPGHFDIAPEPVGELAAVLTSQGVTTVVADYWIAYALTFETDERIIATPDATVRYQPYHERVLSAGATHYVLHQGSAATAALEKRAAQQGIPFERTSIAKFVLYRLDSPLA